MNKGLNKKTQDKLKEYFNNNDIRRNKQSDKADRGAKRNDKNNVLRFDSGQSSGGRR